jgi:hypothetical protein
VCVCVCVCVCVSIKDPVIKVLKEASALPFCVAGVAA